MVESSKVVAYCRSQGSIVADRPYIIIIIIIVKVLYTIVG